MFISFRKPVPRPKPFYREKPVATIAVILTMIAMFVLGPIGAIYKGMTEELKKKADYGTVILILKQQKEKDDRQWQEINRQRQQATISAPKNVQIQQGKRLTPSEYDAYIKMTPERKEAYKKYRTDVTEWPQ